MKLRSTKLTEPKVEKLPKRRSNISGEKTEKKSSRSKKSEEKSSRVLRSSKDDENESKLEPLDFFSVGCSDFFICLFGRIWIGLDLE